MSNEEEVGTLVLLVVDTTVCDKLVPDDTAELEQDEEGGWVLVVETGADMGALGLGVFWDGGGWKGSMLITTRESSLDIL